MTNYLLLKGKLKNNPNHKLNNKPITKDLKK